MADAKKCDRCDEYYDPKYEVWYAQKNIRKEGDTNRYYDLCENCQTELDRFMDGIPLLEKERDDKSEA